ncbi:SprT family zinc-dependent metalloprotease [Paracoccus bogoriensis]|uniref:M48 family metallopeptidase n=1 Tax=Paracoccus bogoriensis TaxID=242065 RepID=UPI0031BB7F20
METTFTINGGLTVRIKRSARARRMTLRVPRDGGTPVLTLPQRAAAADGIAFVHERADWLRAAMGRRPLPRMVAAGAVLPVEGRGLRIAPAPLRAVAVSGDSLLVPEARPVGPVIAAWLRGLAAARLRDACDRHAARLGRPWRALVLRDTRSRWGSCTHDGRLMFSWRLAMAPPDVLDYVAAHEVAHLAHMDHSSRFWATVETLLPDHASPRAWLRAEGASLMLWRFHD